MDEERPVRVLCVGIDGGRLTDLQTGLERYDTRIEVVPEADAHEISERLDDQDIECIVSGHRPPDFDGLALLEAVRTRDRDLPCIIYTRYDDESHVTRALDAGATDYVVDDPERDQIETLANRIVSATERYRLDQQLASVRQRYDLVARAATDAFWGWNAETDTFRWERGFGEAFGYDDEAVEASVDWWTARIHPDDREEALETLTRCLEANGASYTDTYRFRRGDGSYAQVLAHGYAFYDGHESPTQVVGALTDVTSHLEYQARFRDLIEYSSDAITVVDERGTVEYVSPSVGAVVGWSRSEFVDSNVLEYVHPDDRQQVLETFLGLVDEPGETAGPLQYRFRQGDGSWTWLESVASAPGEDAITGGFVVNTRNITDRRQRLHDLRKFEQAVEHAGQAVFVTDPDGIIEYVNPAFEELTGYSASEAVGESPNMLHSGEQDDDYYDRLWETISRGDVWEDTIVDRRQSGERYTALQTITPIPDEAGGIQGYVAVQKDITDRLLREQRLTVLNRLLRHNLSNDMQVILSHVDLLKEQVEDSETITTSVDVIWRRATDLLAEAEKVREFQTLLTSDDLGSRSLADVESALRQRVETQFPDRDVEIDLAIDGVSVIESVERALLELIENAVEHTDDAAVRVTAELNDTNEVEITVVDTGAGLPDEEQLVLESGTETPLEHSQGIGIWLVHWVVQNAGGSVEFEESEPRGTRIRIRVPQAGDAE